MIVAAAEVYCYVLSAILAVNGVAMLKKNNIGHNTQAVIARTQHFA